MEELELFLFIRVTHRNRESCQEAGSSRVRTSSCHFHVKVLKTCKRKQEECLGMVSTDEEEEGRCPGRGSLGALTVFIKLPELGGHMGVCNNTLIPFYRSKIFHDAFLLENRQATRVTDLFSSSLCQ